jgi:hypothetical protein
MALRHAVEHSRLQTRVLFPLIGLYTLTLLSFNREKKEEEKKEVRRIFLLDLLL